MNVNDIEVGQMYKCETKAGELTREVISVENGVVAFDTGVHDELRELSVEDFVKVLEESGYELVVEAEVYTVRCPSCDEMQDVPSETKSDARSNAHDNARCPTCDRGMGVSYKGREMVEASEIEQVDEAERMAFISATWGK